MKHIKKFNEDIENYPDESLRELVRQILITCKHDPDEVEENDPEFIDYIGEMIKRWKETGSCY